LWQYTPTARPQQTKPIRFPHSFQNVTNGKYFSNVLDQSVASKLETTRINTKDFDTIKTLATGAVGKVCLVKSKKTGQVYAMKILKKHDLLTRQEARYLSHSSLGSIFHGRKKCSCIFSKVGMDYNTLRFISG
jgi:serine/threonine protein kinase